MKLRSPEEASEPTSAAGRSANSADAEDRGALQHRAAADGFSTLHNLSPFKKTFVMPASKQVRFAGLVGGSGTPIAGPPPCQS